MSLSDDKVIPFPSTFQSLAAICEPHIKGLRLATAQTLEREAAEADFRAEKLWREAQSKRLCAKLIREGAPK